MERVEDCSPAREGQGTRIWFLFEDANAFDTEAPGPWPGGKIGRGVCALWRGFRSSRLWANIVLMHRDDLLQKLERYRPTDAAEIEHRQQIIEFVTQHEDCFERSLLVGHMTGAAWLIDEQHGRALLTHHRKLDKWLQLGGHCDGDSDILRVALKEAQEESGIDHIESVSADIFDLDVHPIPARGEVPEHLHYDIRFLCRITGDATFTVSDESHDLAWVTPDEIATMLVGRSITRMCEKWVAWMKTGRLATVAGSISH